MLKITFYGEIGSRMGPELLMELSAPATTVGDLRKELASSDEAAAGLLRPTIRAAVDNCVVRDDAEVKDGQEVCFFSIVSGG